MNRLTLLILLLLPNLIYAQSLPQVFLTYDAIELYSFSMGTLSYCDQGDTLSTDCLVRQRGGQSSISRQKKSFAIKCIDEEGAKKDIKLANLRKDNYWILNAAACDPSRIRDLVSWKLWLDFSTPPYHLDREPKAINGSRGTLVEVWVNGSYNGIYTLMERIDRKQLKLKKYDSPLTDENGDITTEARMRGVLYKASLNSSRSTYFNYQSQNPVDTLATWDGFEAQYPNIEEGEPFSWQPLRKTIYYLAASSSTTFKNSLTKRIDLPVFIDWELFKQLMAALDNYGKNYYLWFYDTVTEDKMGVTPWDLDWTWGSDSRCQHVAPDLDTFQKDNLQKRLTAYYRGYGQMLEERWQELRQHYFVEDSLCARFNKVFDLMESTGAADRERERWDGVNNIHINLTEERAYLNQWIPERIAFLDAHFNYVAPDAIETMKEERTTTQCYDLLGRPMKTKNSLNNRARIQITW